MLASQSRRYGAHVVPGVLPAAAFGMTPETAAGIPLVEYGARVLARICEAALEWEHDPLVTFADYADLPELVLSDLLAAWSLTPTEADLAAMAAAGARDAKNPSVGFDRQEVGRRGAPSPEIEAAAERWLMPAYERLRSARTIPGGACGG
ncbi:MAG: hypothetical protein QOD63_2385 [Actinomycetota bacterium]|nr:hypothetical protein [Actinomycetota bacterium]